MAIIDRCISKYRNYRSCFSLSLSVSVVLARNLEIHNSSTSQQARNFRELRNRTKPIRLRQGCGPWCLGTCLKGKSYINFKFTDTYITVQTKCSHMAAVLPRAGMRPARRHSAAGLGRGPPIYCHILCQDSITLTKSMYKVFRVSYHVDRTVSRA